MAGPGMRAAIAAFVAITLCGAPVRAEPTTTAVSEPTSPEADERARAEKLYQDGLAAFDTAEYLDAIRLWSEAYRMLPNTPESADIKRYLTNNLAVAREKQFGIDGDVQHLKRALDLARNYRDSIDALYGDDPRAEQERTRTDEFLARVQAKVDEAERKREPVAPPKIEPTKAPTQVDEPTKPSDRPGRGAIIGGSVLLGLGGVTGIVLLAGVGIGKAADDVDPNDSMEARGKQFDRGRAGNKMAIAGAVLTPLLLAAGIALVVVGVKRRKASRVAIAPSGAVVRF